MGAIVAFPTMRNVLYSGDNIQKFTATAIVKAGQVVAFADTGLSDSVLKSVKATTKQPIGVALYGVGAGESVAVAMDGCIVYVANTDAVTTIDAGDVLESTTNAVGGCVDACAVVTTGVKGLLLQKIGIAVDDIAASGTGRMLITAGYFTTANDA